MKKWPIYKERQKLNKLGTFKVRCQETYLSKGVSFPIDFDVTHEKISGATKEKAMRHLGKIVFPYLVGIELGLPEE